MNSFISYKHPTYPRTWFELTDEENNHLFFESIEEAEAVAGRIFSTPVWRIDPVLQP